MTDTDPIAGVLLVDKPLGPTSMGVCARVRGALKAGGAPKRIKVGHGGTLDPLASGLMVVLVGPATKLCNTIMAGEKRYLATIDLAHTSPTDDLESEPAPAAIDTEPTLDQIEATLPAFTGRIMQAPPAHSAMKVGGQRAYTLARAGQLDALEPRPVVIHELRIESFDWPMLTLDVRCGKGTYIRSLARDLGRTLGVGGTLAGLRRTRVGRFDVADAVGLGDVPRTLKQIDLLITPEVEAILAKRRPGGQA
ncbi:MAG: tRNA pseudouridine(55) synthase TruB [Phycisphaeraceae bacterium]|nr:MAG: tRNA pseudouridine(55) synthase TruB [Phycisphaeraceae bacterium]